MSNDPWDRPIIPALQYQVRQHVNIERTGGPERIYDSSAADPDWKPRPVGFTAHIATEREPILWEGDGA